MAKPRHISIPLLKIMAEYSERTGQELPECLKTCDSSKDFATKEQILKTTRPSAKSAVKGLEMQKTGISGDGMNVMALEYSIFKAGQNPVFGEYALTLRLDDEAAGAFFVIKSNEENTEPGQVRLDTEEIRLIAKLSEKMLAEYERYEAQVQNG
jgi:hypothetical protein